MPCLEKKCNYPPRANGYCVNHQCFAPTPPLRAKDVMNAVDRDRNRSDPKISRPVKLPNFQPRISCQPSENWPGQFVWMWYLPSGVMEKGGSTTHVIKTVTIKNYIDRLRELGCEALATEVHMTIPPDMITPFAPPNPPPAATVAEPEKKFDIEIAPSVVVEAMIAMAELEAEKASTAETVDAAGPKAFLRAIDRVLEAIADGCSSADLIRNRTSIPTGSVQTYIATLSRLDKIESFGTDGLRKLWRVRKEEMQTATEEFTPPAPLPDLAASPITSVSDRERDLIEVLPGVVTMKGEQLGAEDIGTVDLHFDAEKEEITVTMPKLENSVETVRKVFVRLGLPADEVAFSAAEAILKEEVPDLPKPATCDHLPAVLTPASRVPAKSVYWSPLPCDGNYVAELVDRTVAMSREPGDDEEACNNATRLLALAEEAWMYREAKRITDDAMGDHWVGRAAGIPISAAPAWAWNGMLDAIMPMVRKLRAIERTDSR